ncbi:MAG: hypothetical protein HYY01_11805 [Chloroflexi bacterium]|nr:hypothetical protein [Chloroflexota bacterium]
MSRIVLIASLGIALILAACSPNQAPQTPFLEDFQINGELGQWVELDKGMTLGLPSEGLTFTFREVQADSRCPSDVQCVWAGEARVLLVVRQPGPAQAWEATEVSVVEPGGVSQAQHRYGGHVLTYHLTPYPEAARPTTPDHYQLRLQVTRAPQPGEPPSDTGAATPAITPPDILFAMKGRYQLGEPVEVRVRNQSKAETYYYQSYYPACYNLKFFDGSSERRPYPYADPAQPARFLLPGQFIIPRGTHCDLVFEKQLGPDEEVVLLTWDQDMCIKDRWGCVESVQVGPGEYRIVGEFSRIRKDIGPASGERSSEIAVAEWKFVIE